MPYDTIKGYQKISKDIQRLHLPDPRAAFFACFIVQNAFNRRALSTLHANAHSATAKSSQNAVKSAQKSFKKQKTKSLALENTAELQYISEKEQKREIFERREGCKPSK